MQTYKVFIEKLKVVGENSDYDAAAQLCENKHVLQDDKEKPAGKTKLCLVLF